MQAEPFHNHHLPLLSSRLSVVETQFKVYLSEAAAPAELIFPFFNYNDNNNNNGTYYDGDYEGTYLFHIKNGRCQRITLWASKLLFSANFYEIKCFVKIEFHT